jgi:hypothetical protein
MKNFLKTKTGLFMVGLFVCMMAFAFYRVNQRHQSHETATAPEPIKTLSKEATNAPGGPPKPDVAADERDRQQMQQAAYIGSYRQNAGQSRQEQDRNGNTGTRRATAAKPHEAGTETVQTTLPTVASEPAAPPPNFTLRLQGRPAAPTHASRKAGPSTSDLAEQMGAPTSAANAPQPASAAPSVGPTTSADPATLPHPGKPARFLPFGYPIKCELVFTIDSTMESTPLIGLVTAPVYNNGQLIIPAGAELHGTARPDRMRDRLYSSPEWVLIFPREGNKPNGRQLNVRGLALDRAQPDDNGLTWGITDGSYGLQGDVIRTASNEELQRFAATTLEAVAAGLQSTHANAYGGQMVDNTPRNALLQGVGADMALVKDKLRAEIERNGVFIRVPAGKQFYFYPQQIIDPDLADISSNIASVQ